MKSLHIKNFLLPVLLLFTLCANAQIVTEDGKAYRLHTVAKGESFNQLSVTYGVTQEEIILANPDLRKTGLVKGAQIRIPLKAQDASKQTKQEKPEDRPVIIHTARQGEKGITIAKLYDMTYLQLLQLNPEIASGIREGQKLKVYAVNQQPSSSVRYIVKDGETLFSIAKAYGITHTQLLELNPTTSINVKAGDIINVPAK